jgi:hypothetical protein
MVAELFAEEVDFMCAGSEKVPWIRPRRTREDMADMSSASLWLSWSRLVVSM